MLLLLPALTGCLTHTRKLPPLRKPELVLTADAAELVAGINRSYEAVQSLTATVTFQATVNKSVKGEGTDYTGVPGYILLRKPGKLRVLGLVPVLHTHAFDLASDGQSFRLVIPPLNKAIEGSSSKVTKPAANPLMNLRPSMFFDALLIDGLRPDDLVFVTNDSDIVPDPSKKFLMEKPEYDLTIVRKKEGSSLLMPVRVIHFSRIDLLPYKQEIYNENGDVETQTIYGPYQTFGNQRFPGTVTIKRPLEEYQIVLTISKLTLNQSLADDQFELKIPEDMPLQKLD